MIRTGRNNEKNERNNTTKVVAGGITATIIILLIAFTNAIGYIGNALTDPKNSAVWITIAIIVFVTAGIIEIKKGGE